MAMESQQPSYPLRVYNIGVRDRSSQQFRLVYLTDNIRDAYRRYKYYQKRHGKQDVVVVNYDGMRVTIGCTGRGRGTDYRCDILYDFFDGDGDGEVEFPDVFARRSVMPKIGVVHETEVPLESISVPVVDDAVAAPDAESAPPENDQGCSAQMEERSVYAATDNGMCLCRDGEEGGMEPISNFTAKIVTDIAVVGSGQGNRYFEVEANFAGEVQRFELPAADFDALRWVAGYLPVAATVFPRKKQHVGAAIRSLSSDVGKRTVFCQSGWHRLQNAWVYADAGGVIGEAGLIEDAGVMLPDALRLYRLPLGQGMAEFRDAVKASIDLVDLARGQKLAPLVAGVYRSVLGSCGFSVYLVGRSNVFKTEVLSLAMRHFGAGLTPDNLSASWSSTPAGIAAIAEAAKDSVVALDDLVSARTASDASRADRIFRDSANGVARQRASSTGGSGAATQMRSLLIATGEELPPGQSLNARLVSIDLQPGDVCRDKLSRCQSHASDGSYGLAMSAYIRWLASRLDAVRNEVASRATQHRESLVARIRYPRIANAIAELLAGYEAFIDFAVDIGAISSDQGVVKVAAVRDALLRAAANQDHDHLDQDPAHRFVELIKLAFTAGAAHLDSLNAGQTPPGAHSFGWRLVNGWRDQPQGKLIGYTDGDDIYLLPDAAYRVADQVASAGAGVGVKAQTLWKRLDEAGMLQTTELKSHGTRVVRRTVRGHRIGLIHLKMSSLGIDLQASDDYGRYAFSETMPSDIDGGSQEGLRAALMHQMGYEFSSDQEAS